MTTLTIYVNSGTYHDAQGLPPEVVEAVLSEFELGSNRILRVPWFQGSEALFARASIEAMIPSPDLIQDPPTSEAEWEAKGWRAEDGGHVPKDR